MEEGRRQEAAYFISLKDDRPFAFAGRTEYWRCDDQVIESATIINTEANSLLSEIQDRIPVILPSADPEYWLDPEFEGKKTLLSLLKPYPEQEMRAILVGHAGQQSEERASIRPDWPLKYPMNSRRGTALSATARKRDHHGRRWRSGVHSSRTITRTVLGAESAV